MLWDEEPRKQDVFRIAIAFDRHNRVAIIIILLMVKVKYYQVLK